MNIWISNFHGLCLVIIIHHCKITFEVFAINTAKSSPLSVFGSDITTQAKPPPAFAAVFFLSPPPVDIFFERNPALLKHICAIDLDTIDEDAEFEKRDEPRPKGLDILRTLVDAIGGGSRFQLGLAF